MNFLWAAIFFSSIAISSGVSVGKALLAGVENLAQRGIR